jgi:predicted nuclease of restriction endonuclease-like (RecB) superfamily
MALKVIFPEFDQFSTHCVGNLNWTNVRMIMRLDNQSEREYYIREASEQNWSSRLLERNIKTGYYRRLLSTQQKGIISIPDNEKYNPADFIKDPYVAEFLLELGKGFSFVDRQMRISTETSHFYVDLVFYNYLLKCFVIVDLKTNKLNHADIGQMDMYVRMFDALKRGEDDNPTVGIILCAEKDETIVKYSVLKESRQIFASKYQTVLPTEEELAEMIMQSARKMIEI